MSHEYRKSKNVAKGYFCGRTVTEITTTMSKRYVLIFALKAKCTMVKGIVLKIMFTYI